MVRFSRSLLQNSYSLFMQVLKIQPQTFKSSYIKLIALLWSLFLSLILAMNMETMPLVKFIPYTTVYVIFGVVYLITAIIYIVVRNVRKDCKCLKAVWLVDIGYLVSGLLYYVGRNLDTEVLQPMLLGMVVLIHQLVRFFISKYYQSNLAKEHQTTEAKLQLVPEWILAAESLTLLVEFDALYSVIINFEPSNRCSYNLPMIGAWVTWNLLLLAYVAVLYYTINIQYCGKYDVNKFCVSSNLGAIVLVAAFGMHLLANNNLPLVCFQANPRMTRTVMKALVLLVVISTIVLLLVFRCQPKTRQDKLLPRALYQHLHPEPEKQNDLPLETVVDNKDKKHPIA